MKLDFNLLHLSQEKRKFLIIILSGALLFALDIFLVIIPLINKNRDLRTQTVAVKKNISEANRLISSFNASKELLGVLREKQPVYEKKFPREEEIPALLANLASIARASSVDIIAIRPIKVQAPPAGQAQIAYLHEIPFEILAKGGYHQIGYFINRIENSDRFMEIKNIDISQDASTPRSHNLKLIVYMYIVRM